MTTTTTNARVLQKLRCNNKFLTKYDKAKNIAKKYFFSIIKLLCIHQRLIKPSLSTAGKAFSLLLHPLTTVLL